jgi:hypothetical protein
MGQPGAVADIQVVVAEMTCRFPQPLQAPLRVPFRTKKVGALVVVNTDNGLRPAVEEADKLRTDKPTGTSDKYFHGRLPIIYAVYTVISVWRVLRRRNRTGRLLLAVPLLAINLSMGWQFRLRRAKPGP